MFEWQICTNFDEIVYRSITVAVFQLSLQCPIIIQNLSGVMTHSH